MTEDRHDDTRAPGAGSSPDADGVGGEPDDPAQAEVGEGSEDTDEQFTLRPRGGGGFGMVEAALARKLRSLAERQTRTAVIVSIEDGGQSNHYTQTLVDREDGAWVEAVSNAFIESADHQLSDDQVALLTALGFDPPTDVVPNHFVIFDQPVDWDRVAALVVRALESVYGVPATAVIQVRAITVERPDDEDELSDDAPDIDGTGDDGGNGEGTSASDRADLGQGHR